jgi:hypothetical protein
MFATTTFFNKTNIFNQSLKDYALKSTYDSIQKYINPKLEKKLYNISFPLASSSPKENNNPSSNPSLPFLSIAFVSSIVGFILYYRNKK